MTGRNSFFPNPQISMYKNGYRHGFTWEFQVGGGMLAGFTDDKGELTGDGITYFYPDKFTTLVGEFNNGVMKAAQESR